MTKLWDKFKDVLLGEMCEEHNERKTPTFGCISCESDLFAQKSREIKERKRQERVQEIADGILLAEKSKGVSS